MTLHPVLDAAELARALDVAHIEDLVAAILRRASRALALGEAAYHEACVALDPGRRDELVIRCATSARLCRNYADAVRALAPHSDFDAAAEGHACAAATFDRLAQVLVSARPARSNHA